MIQLLIFGFQFLQGRLNVLSRACAFLEVISQTQYRHSAQKLVPFGMDFPIEEHRDLDLDEVHFRFLTNEVLRCEASR